MKKIILSSLLIIALFIILVTAQEEHDFTKTKQLINSKISCDSLTDEQLEAIGDYYMEQMHPGEAHELMHEMMGGHDSELTKNMHINMAKSIYCNEDVGMGSMMNMMAGGNGMMGNNMMSGGMMNMRRGDMMSGNEIINEKNTMYGYGNYNSGFAVISWITYVMMIMLIVSAIYWLIKSANREK